MTIRNFFDATVTRYPERPAQRFYAKNQWNTRSYAELKTLVLRTVSIIRDNGIRPGKDNVVLMLANCPEWEIIYLALACTGVTVVPVDPKLRERELHHIFKDACAKAVFACSKSQAVIEKVATDLPDLKLCVYTNAKALSRETQNTCKIIRYEETLEAVELTSSLRNWYEEHKPEDSSIASILYTSGTTGVPKGALLTHANFEANADFAKNAVPFSHLDDFLVLLPLFHAFSFTFSLVTPVYSGGCCSFPRSIKTLSEDLQILRPTTILAVPLLAEKLVAKIKCGLQGNILARTLISIGLKQLLARKVAAVFGGRLRIMAIGGAPTAPGVLNFLRDFGVPAVEGYGLSECGPLVSFPPMDKVKIGSVGTLLPCMEAKLANADASGAGELLVKGPNVTQGYYNNPTATAAAFDDEGFFRTGDIVQIDADGYIHIHGRTKALIVNREGKNIYPEEIEMIVNRSPAIAQSLCIGYRLKGETGEHVGLIVQPTEEASQARESAHETDAQIIADIQRLCAENLADYKIPRKIVIRSEAFELTSTMKVKRMLYSGTLDEGF